MLLRQPRRQPESVEPTARLTPSPAPQARGRVGVGVAVRRTAFAAAPQSYCNGRRPHPSPPPQAGERTQSPQPLSGCLKQTKGQTVRPAKVIANIIVALIIPITVVRIGVYLYARQADMHYTVPDSLIGQPLAAAETAMGIKFSVR